jgi:hypothetical protein
MATTINPGRLIDAINAFGSIGRTVQGTTRLALTDADKEARDLLIE